MKRSDINFVGTLPAPLQALMAGQMGTAQVSTPDTKNRKGSSAGGSKEGNATPAVVSNNHMMSARVQEAAARYALGALQKAVMGAPAAAALNPIGFAINTLMSEGFRAITGDTPAGWLTSGVKDMAGVMAPAGYESNLSYSGDGRPTLGSPMSNLGAYQAIGNAVNAGDSSAIGYGSGVGVGGALGGGVGSMGGANSYGQGGSYGGGGI